MTKQSRPNPQQLALRVRTYDSLSRQWQNATRALLDPSKSALHGRARQLISAINQEWVRRSRLHQQDEAWFRWPNTDAPGGSGGLSGIHWYPDGPLSLLGYHVGESAAPTSFRWAVLDHIFLETIPPAFPPDQMHEWDRPGGAGRLHKLARSLAAFARNAKRRRDRGFQLAIADWEEDLGYLHDTYYVRRFHFDWPRLEID